MRGLLREASRTCRPDFGEGITAGWTTATLRAGRYELVCDLRNHSANRMLQARTVSFDPDAVDVEEKVKRTHLRSGGPAGA